MHVSARSAVALFLALCKVFVEPTVQKCVLIMCVCVGGATLTKNYRRVFSFVPIKSTLGIYVNSGHSVQDVVTTKPLRYSLD